jgi:predicted Zn-dependent protease
MLEGGVLNKSGYLELLGNVLSFGVSQRIDQLEAVLTARDRNLTRFAKSRIHQHMAERNVDIAIRVFVGKKQGSIHLNTLELPKLEEGVLSAMKIAKLQPGNAEFVSLPSYDNERLPGADELQDMTYFNATTVHPPEAKANEIKDLIDQVTTKQAEEVSGAYTTEVTELAVVNSLGVEVYNPSTLASMNANMKGPKGSTAYAAFVSRNVRDLDISAMARDLKGRLKRSKNPQKIDPKSYPTVFEHYATGELMVFLSSMGFSAKAVSEGWSFLTDKFDEKIMASEISIWDDGLDPRGLPVPFDYEGVPKQRVELITEGYAKGVVYDSYTAGLAGRSSTGHALPAPNPWGPQPSNLFLGEGSSTLKEMIEDTRLGILVSKIHYANPLDPKNTMLTGMTRDGTFLIENGEISHALKNLRFTQSLEESFRSTKMVGKELIPTRSWYGASTVPAIKVDKFKFTGTTEH